ncbi:MAG: hypothetical protein FWD35_03895 [Oscillospiraceae bacterium]|nr:hypothetical protein [Oscillospiraceae bacterium]
MIRLGKVLSQGEIDGLLQEMLEDKSVLPLDSDEGGETAAPRTFGDLAGSAAVAATPSVGVSHAANNTGATGLAAFKAKIAAAKAAQAGESGE